MGVGWNELDTKKSRDSPRTAHGHSMAYDAAEGVLTCSVDSTLHSSTCPTHGCGMERTDTKESNDRSLGRNAHSMAYDAVNAPSGPVRRPNYTESSLSDTWVWDGTNWTQRVQ